MNARRCSHGNSRLPLRHPSSENGSYAESHIYKQATEDFPKMGSVTFADGIGLTTIPEGTFHNCEGLTELIFPEKITVHNLKMYFLRSVISGHLVLSLS